MLDSRDHQPSVRPPFTHGIVYNVILQKPLMTVESIRRTGAEGKPVVSTLFTVEIRSRCKRS